MIGHRTKIGCMSGNSSSRRNVGMLRDTYRPFSSSSSSSPSSPACSAVPNTLITSSLSSFVSYRQQPPLRLQSPSLTLNKIKITTTNTDANVNIYPPQRLMKEQRRYMSVGTRSISSSSNMHGSAVRNTSAAGGSSPTSSSNSSNHLLGAASSAEDEAAHFTAWGESFVNRNHSMVMDEQGFNAAMRSRRQLEWFAQQVWDPKAKMHMCGSVVTQGLMEQNSDLDICCLLGEIVPDRDKQNELAQKLFWNTMNHMPTYIRKEFTHQHGATTPVTKLRHPPHVAAEGAYRDIPDTNVLATKSSRTIVFHISPEFPMSEDKFGAVVAKFNEKHAVVKKSPEDVFIGNGGEGDAVESWEMFFPVPDEYSPGMFKLDNTSAHLSTKWANDMNAGSTAIRMTLRDTATAMHALELLPGDGSLMTSGQSMTMLKKDFVDRRFIAPMIRYEFDVSFAGWPVANSYLVRRYFHHSPGYVRHGALALKGWAKACNVASRGFLTSYTMQTLWLYYLLVAGKVEWVDPNHVPHPAELPVEPLYTPLPECDTAELGREVCEFFRFYARHFDYEREMASLNRPRRSTRADVGWQNIPDNQRGDEHFHFCIEDPDREVGKGGINMGRALGKPRFEFVKREFEKAMRSMLLHTPSTVMDPVMLFRRRAQDAARDQRRAEQKARTSEKRNYLGRGG